jgi:HTH-type transcriptional regulator/antitoxin HigA
MPVQTYEDLLAESAPEVIGNAAQYRQIAERCGALVGKGRARTPQETTLMRLLALLIEDYDRRHALPPDDSSPAERLKFLLEHSGKTPADLVSIFGQRSHVNEALNDKRKISADQARQLGKIFFVNPGLFL